MLSEKQIEKLKNNWAKAESLACYAEIRLYDSCSPWQCFLLAVNPQDDDEVFCIISTNAKSRPEVTLWSLRDIACLFNSEGEPVKQDDEYRPIRAAELFKKLSELTIYERY